MDERYFIFRLQEGKGARARKAYLGPDGRWGASRARVLRGSLRRMQAMARKLRAACPHLIIERAETPPGRGRS
jgi:hypothetical protein